ncbi:nucleoside triphosphate pyrophosphohydrolase [bacterium]|nr:nucleoside triphosphate pyrophosphohydrolase [bacterium]
MTEKEQRPVSNAEKKAAAFLRLNAIVAALRAPDGCPWDREQTSYSLAPAFLEEAHELIDAIESGDTEEIKEEDGDILLHGVMQAYLFEEQGLFDVADVLNGISDKLVRRHPHVFGTLHVSGSEEVMKNWEAIKKEEKAQTRKSVLDGLSNTLPALAAAAEIQRKAAKQNFDWTEIEPVFAKCEEEFRELKEARSENNKDHVEEEFGDLLFALVNLSRFMDVNAEQALRSANRKFIARFKKMEKLLEEDHLVMRDQDLATLDSYWEKVKAQERS